MDTIDPWYNLPKLNRDVLFIFIKMNKTYYIVNIQSFKIFNSINLLINTIHGIMLLPLFIVNLKIPKYSKFFLIGILLFTIIGLYWGLHFYKYYRQPLLIFLIIPCISISLFFEKYLIKVIKFKFSSILYIALFILCSFLAYKNANYQEMIGMSKNEMFQFKYADYISQYDNPTLLNMGFLDGGLYTTTGIVPNTKFFEVQNIPYDKFPDNLDDMKYNVEHKNIMFILYYTTKDLEYVRNHDGYIFDNYELIFDDQYIFENELHNAFLFKLKN